jgi:hypothetical protein
MQVPDLFLVGATAIRAVPDPGDTLKLFVGQSILTRWCWAAVAVGVANFYGDYSKDQCVTASLAFHEPPKTCCPNGGNCPNTTQYLSDILGIHHDGLAQKAVDRTLSFVKSRIDAHHPVPIRMKNDRDEGHYMVIAGYCVNALLEERVALWDPRYVFSRPIHCPLQTLLTGYDAGWTWDYSYLTKRK